MNRKTISILVLCGYFIFVPSIHAAGSSGLVDGIWFSREIVTDFGETIVYSVVHNQTNSQIQGIATLVVDGVAISAQEVQVGSKDIKRVAIPYKFTDGSHRVSMSFTAGNGVEVSLAELAAVRIFVVQDTDGDGIQNSTDPDDDNDGIVDEEDDEPLVKQIIPRPSVDLSETGRNFLKKITSRRDEGEAKTDTKKTPEEPEQITDDSTSEPNVLVSTFRTLEDTRKRGATTMRGYEEERRAALEEIVRLEDELPAVEGFETPIVNESKQREHQIAAAGASVIGTILEEAWLFYLHIFVLIMSVVHLAWGWFKSRFRNLGSEDDE